MEERRNSKAPIVNIRRPSTPWSMVSRPLALSGAVRG